MGSIIEKIKALPKLYHFKGCTQEQVNEAEQALNLQFPQEFIDYVREFGAISFYGTEWTGLNVDGYLNVVDATNDERELNSNFPTNCFVLENIGIDGILVIVNPRGQVFAFQYGNIEFLTATISEYLDECKKRDKR